LNRRISLYTRDLVLLLESADLAVHDLTGSRCPPWAVDAQDDRPDATVFFRPVELRPHPGDHALVLAEAQGARLCELRDRSIDVDQKDLGPLGAVDDLLDQLRPATGSYVDVDAAHQKQGSQQSTSGDQSFHGLLLTTP
jgi:hypothetical protein